MALPTGWGRKQKITIDNTKVSGTSNLTDFRKLVTLDHLSPEIVDAGSNSALNGGGDLRFTTDSAGLNQLACDIETFVTNATPASRECVIWVKIPTVTYSTDTDIYIWYKKAGETQPAVTDTYGRNAVWSGLIAVLHLNEAPNTTSGGYVDSTGNGHDGTASTTLTADTLFGLDATGDFRNQAGYISIPDHADFDFTDAAHVSALCRNDDVSNDGIAVSKRSAWSATGIPFELSLAVSNNVSGRMVGNVSASRSVTDIGVDMMASARVVSGTTYTVVDDLAEVTATTPNSGTFVNNAVDIVIGALPSSFGEKLNGPVRELRISSSPPSKDKLYTEHENINAPATFATAGTPEDATVPPVIDNQACDFGAKTLINDGAFQLVNTGGGVDTIGAITGTASTQYNVNVVSNEIVLTAKVASPSAGTVIIADVTGLDATNIGSVTVTVSAIANAYSAATMQEIEDAYNDSAIAFSDQILTRDFQEGEDCAIFYMNGGGAINGTWNGTNYVEITPHDGAVTKIGGMWCNGTNCRYIHFSGIFFTGDGSVAIYLLNFAAGANNIKVSNCHFEDSKGYEIAGNWSTAIGCNNNLSSDFDIVDNTFDYVGGLGSVMVLRGSNITISGNIVEQGIDEDFCQLAGVGMHNITITDNKIYKKYLFEAASHGDFFQLLGSSLTADITGFVFERNIMSRGQDVNELLDGEGLFMSNYTIYKLDGGSIKNNEFIGTYARGISVIGDNLDIQYNTIVHDKYAAPTTRPTTYSGIYLLGGDGCTLSNNVTNLIDIDVSVTNLTQNNNQIANEAAVSPATDSYAKLFNGPKGGASLTNANFVTSYKAKVGGLLDTNQIGARDTDGNYMSASAAVGVGNNSGLGFGLSVGF